MADEAQPAGTVFETIARRRSAASASELKVADLLLTLPDLPLSASMRAVARRAGVSDATVLRFCRGLGFEGYSDFRLAIARATANAVANRPENAHSEDAAGSIIAIGEALNRQAQAIAANSDFSAFDEIASRIAHARSLEVFAFGISRVAGWDFVNQIERCGVPATLLSDPHIQLLRAQRVTSASVALFLSIGFSRLLVEIAEAVKEVGACTVAVTTAGTPLSTACTHCINLPGELAGNAGPPTEGRFAQLLVLDALAGDIRKHTGGGPERSATTDPRFSY